MHITFIKGAAKYDQMRVRSGNATKTVDCPKQRIIPHDMVHYAVESTLQHRGFLGRIRDGEGATFQMDGEPESDGVERLVEVFQGDAWSGGTSTPEDMLAMYQVTCRARSCPPLAVTPDDIVAVRQRIADLDRQWQALPVGHEMDMEL